MPEVIMDSHAISTPSQVHVSTEPHDTSSNPIQQPSPSPPQSAPTPTASSPIGPARTATIMLCLCLAVFVAALDITIITTALPSISSHFHSPSAYTWIGTSFVLAHAASTPSWASLSDIWGRRPMILGACAAFFLGSLLCALSGTRTRGGGGGEAGSLAELVAARAVQGVGAAGMTVLVNVVIGDMFSQRDRGMYYGLTSVVWAVASGVGPVLGGVLTDKLGWTWCFWINLPIITAVFLLLLFTLRLPTPQTPFRAGLLAIDWPGSVLVIGGTLMLLLGLYLGGVTQPWHSSMVVCLIVFGFLCGGLFIVNEWKVAARPVMPVRLFRTGSSAAAFGLCFLHGFVFMGVAYYLPLYFQAVLGADALMSGVYLVPFVVSSSVSAAATGLYIQKTGRYMPPVYIGMPLMTLGIGLLITLGTDTNWAKLAIFQIIGGCGVGMNFEGPLLAVQVVLPSRDVAAATAAMGFTRTMSTAISVVLGGVVFQNEMGGKQDGLRRELGGQVAGMFNGATATASVEFIKALPAGEQVVVRRAFEESIKMMWVLVSSSIPLLSSRPREEDVSMHKRSVFRTFNANVWGLVVEKYVSVAGFGVLVSYLMRAHDLSKDHEETRLGLDRQDDNDGRDGEAVAAGVDISERHEMGNLTRRA